MSSTKFHVLINKTDSSKSMRVIFKDLSESQLSESFLKPYRQGSKILVTGELIDLTAAKNFKIVATEKSLNEELEIVRKESFEEVQRFNRESSSITFVSAGWGYHDEEIEHVGTDLTSKYLSCPPGEGSFFTSAWAVLNHQWVLTIGGGILVAGLVYILGWS